MKILQLNKYFYQKGGAETVFFNTISTLENRGHQVIPFALKNKKNKFSEYESYLQSTGSKTIITTNFG